MSGITADTRGSVDAQLDAIRQRFVSELGCRLEEINRLWRDAREGGDDGETLRLLHQKVHGLNGSAGTFGFEPLSEIAERIEGVLSLVLAGGGTFGPRQQARIDELLRELGCVSFTSRRPPGSVGAPPAATPKRSIRHDLSTRRLFVLDDENRLDERLALQITNFGYDVKHFTSVEAMLEAAREVAPNAVIIDTHASEIDFENVRTVAALRKERQAAIPILVLSSRSDLIVRLDAVRAGADSYLEKPFDVAVLMDRLEELLWEDPPEPCRVLIVEDDTLLAQHNATVIEHAGMVTRLITDPLTVLEPLNEWNPELILMDLHMPGCTGLELATVIRQDERYVSIPIVFLSSEKNVGRQILAMRHGGDDFLTKPIDREHLISSITARVQRVRTLRSLIATDTLTGLYNHSATVEQLEIEVERAVRSSAPLSFVIVDLDRFKSVNDTHGHSVGSRVIQSVARLLRQRTRKVDIVGRYGGEEFCIIFPGAPESVAQLRVEQMREAWSKVRHETPEREFSVTFSAGVAELRPGMSPQGLLDLADRALYAAKQDGRNRVVVGSEIESESATEASSGVAMETKRA